MSKNIMAEATLKHKILSGVFWQGLERIGSQGLGFVFSIILARLLAPEEFGVVAIMTIFIALSSVFVDSGFSSALVQKKDLEEVDCCSVFYINIAMGILLYGVMFFSAPAVAAFYKAPEVTLYLRVLALKLVISSFSLVQSAMLSKRMLFYLCFRINWSALLGSGLVGIIMAYRGCGVWALIAQQLIYTSITTCMQCFLVRWKPQQLFNWERVRGMFHFGWKLFAASLLNTLYNNIYSIVIGRVFNLTTLSYYNRGFGIPQMGMEAVNSTVGSVLFPAFSEIQHDKEKMRALAQRGLRNIMFAVTPVLIGLGIFAEPIVKILLTDKWLPCVIFMRFACVGLLFWPMYTMNLQVVTASGRSDYFLILEIVKKVRVLLMLWVTYRFGVIAMVAVMTCFAPWGVVENGWFNRKLIGYAPWKQLWDVAPFFLVSVIAGGAVWFLLLPLLSGAWVRLLVGGPAFLLLYCGTAIVFRIFPREIFRILARE